MFKEFAEKLDSRDIAAMTIFAAIACCPLYFVTLMLCKTLLDAVKIIWDAGPLLPY